MGHEDTGAEDVPISFGTARMARRLSGIEN
jgi:hypothetical protein